MAVAGVLLGFVVAALTVSRALGEARDAGFDANLAGPGEEQLLTINEAGAYTVAYTGPIVVLSTVDQEELTEALDISIIAVATGAPVAVQRYEGLNDFEQDGAQYVPLLTVRFAEAGDYTFRSSPMANLDPEQSRLIVSESPWRKLRNGAERAVLILVVAIGLSILLSVILGVTRGRAKRAAAPPPGRWPPPGPPPPGYGPVPAHGPPSGYGGPAPGYGPAGPSGYGSPLPGAGARPVPPPAWGPPPR